MANSTSGFSGLRSVHYVMDVSSDIHAGSAISSNSGNRGRVLNTNGIFTGWKAARWVRRMNRGQESKMFPMDMDGKMRVQQAGVYFIYAQVKRVI